MMSDNLAASVDRAALHRSGTPRIFDAIVIGAGAAGGLAAELLTTAGLDVLLLDAGYSQGILRTPPSRLLTQGLASLASGARVPFLPPAFLRTLMRRSYHVLGRFRQPIQTECYAWDRSPGVLFRGPPFSGFGAAASAAASPFQATGGSISGSPTTTSGLMAMPGRPGPFRPPNWTHGMRRSRPGLGCGEAMRHSLPARLTGPRPSNEQPPSRRH